MAERLRRAKEEIAGVLAILGALYLCLSLFSHTKWDPSLLTYTTNPVKNWGGIVGAYISDALVTVFGVSSFAMPFFMAVHGIKRLLSLKRHRVHLLGFLLFMPSVSLFSGLISSTFKAGFDSPGGILGDAGADLLVGLISVYGAYIFTLAMLLSSIILLSPLSIVSLLVRGGKKEKKKEEEKEKAGEEEGVYNVLNIGEFSAQESPAEERISEPAAGPRVKVVRSMSGGYELPPVDMLKTHEIISQKPSKEELLSASGLLEKKLKDFAVYGKVTQVHSGPIVTMFEFEPAPGVKINRVVSLSDDLALALKAQSVRVSPIHGKAAIGIEVPNRQREMVSIREIITSEGFRKGSSKLTLALGKDIFGNPVTTDLAKMPHLLVAGATGAGKSVSMNSMVMSILYKAGPDEVKMLMIDPKLLELSYYEGIPHLISPVITSPKDASEALRKMVFEMERRYRVLAEKNARSIEGFNRAVPDSEKLPYIVIFIDELADLMFAAQSKVEDSIARLAQMARAAGIHLVIATQRPSVDVITGIIKANFPARIAFQVTTKIDSRTILDSTGAEQMIGKGDMLLMLPGLRTMRIHGAFVSEDEIMSVADFIRAQGSPDYGIMEGIAVEEDPREESGKDKRDELYRRAVEIAESIGEVSISSLQRRLGVGYNRAAKIIELMEEDGRVGPPKGAGKPRDVIRKGRV